MKVCSQSTRTTCAMDYSAQKKFLDKSIKSECCHCRKLIIYSESQHGRNEIKDVKHMGFKQLRVNYKYNFVNLQSSTHTKNVEWMWGSGKWHKEKQGIVHKVSFDQVYMVHLIIRILPLCHFGNNQAILKMDIEM